MVFGVFMRQVLSFTETEYLVMSKTPLSALFELQRETIRQTEAVAEELIRFPAEASDALVTTARAQLELQEQVLELSRQSIHRSLDAAASVSGDAEIDQLRDTVDQTIDRLQEQQEEAFERIETDNDPIDEETIEILGEQTDLLIELNEHVEEQLSETIEEATEADGQSLQDQLETQLEALTEQFETQLDRLTQLDGDETDSVSDDESDTDSE